MDLGGRRRHTNSLVLSAECKSSLKLRVKYALRCSHSSRLAVISSMYADDGKLDASGRDCWIFSW